jgi:hypothetical protein
MVLSVRDSWGPSPLLDGRPAEREARLGSNAAKFERTAPVRKPVPPRWVEGTVREGRDQGLDVDRDEIA